jgi:hypothetical protein
MVIVSISKSFLERVLYESGLASKISSVLEHSLNGDHQYFQAVSGDGTPREWNSQRDVGTSHSLSQWQIPVISRLFPEVVVYESGLASEMSDFLVHSLDGRHQ